MRVFGILGVFFQYFRGILGYFLGSPEFRAGGYFFGIFSWKFRVGQFRGSVAGRGVLNPESPKVHFLVNLFLLNLVRISEFSSLFSAIAVLLALACKMC